MATRNGIVGKEQLAPGIFSCADCFTTGGSLWWTIGRGKKQAILCQKCFKKRREDKK